MNHFFIDPNQFQDKKVFFPADLSHQIVRVLRLKNSSHVMVLDNLENQFEVEFIKLDPNQCVGVILRTEKIHSEPALSLHLMIAMTQREKFELILQKSCELGVRQITPIITERSIHISPQEFEKKLERWTRILREAAEQSRRGLVPTLNPVISLLDALKVSTQLKLIAWENEQSTRLQELMKNDLSDISLMIGPEGGFSENEIKQAQLKGWQVFSLGKRILRMETAAIVACTLVFHTSGDL